MRVCKYNPADEDYYQPLVNRSFKYPARRNPSETQYTPRMRLELSTKEDPGKYSLRGWKAQRSSAYTHVQG